MAVNKMANPILNPQQIRLLRNCLGLGFHTNTPTRNHLHLSSYIDHAADVEGLIDMELMTRKEIAEQGGRRTYVMATDEGRRMAIEYPDNPAHAKT